MRFFLPVVLLILLQLSALAADSVYVKTPLITNIGAWGGFGVDYSEPASKETIEVNFQGGIIFNHWLAAGLSMNAFFTLNPLNDLRYSRDASLLGAYGGILVVPVLYHNSLVHASIPVFIGYGTINYELFDMDQISSHIEDSHQFVVFEPGIEVEINILRFMRMAIGGYYRICSDIKLKYKDNGDPILPGNVLNGFTLGMKLKIGKF